MVSIVNKDVLLATCCGLGKSPWASGTLASVPPVVTYQVLGYLGPESNVYVMGLFVIVGVAMYLGSATSAGKSLGWRARRQIVVDKLAGQGLTMFIIALARPVDICNSMAVGFALFRCIDIINIRFLERRSVDASGFKILLPTYFD